MDSDSLFVKNSDLFQIMISKLFFSFFKWLANFFIYFE